MLQVFPAMLRCNGLSWLNLFPLLLGCYAATSFPDLLATAVAMLFFSFGVLPHVLFQGFSGFTVQCVYSRI